LISYKTKSFAIIALYLFSLKNHVTVNTLNFSSD